MRRPVIIGDRRILTNAQVGAPEEVRSRTAEESSAHVTVGVPHAAISPTPEGDAEGHRCKSLDPTDAEDLIGARGRHGVQLRRMHPTAGLRRGGGPEDHAGKRLSLVTTGLRGWLDARGREA
jgi:hypothetical protein